MTTGTAQLTDAATGLTGTRSAAFTVAPGPLLIPARGAWFGAYPGAGNAEPAAFEVAGLAGRKLDAWYRFYQLATAWPTSADLAGIAGGRFLVVDLEPSFAVPPATGSVTYAQVTSGSQDSRLAEAAAGLNALPGPALVAWQAEPELSARSPYGTAAQYIASFQYVASYLRAHAPGKAVMCWVVSSGSAASAAFYPGDNFTDWIGVDPYDQTLAKGSPAATYGPFMTWLAAQPFGKGKPVGVFETGVDSTVADSAEAAWIAAVPAALQSLGYKLWMWFNSSGTLGNCAVIPGSQAAAALAAAGAAPFLNQPHA